MLFDFNSMTFYTKAESLTLEQSALLVTVPQRHVERSKRSASEGTWFGAALEYWDLETFYARALENMNHIEYILVPAMDYRDMALSGKGPYHGKHIALIKDGSRIVCGQERGYGCGKS